MTPICRVNMIRADPSLSTPQPDPYQYDEWNDWGGYYSSNASQNYQGEFGRGGTTRGGPKGQWGRGKGKGWYCPNVQNVPNFQSIPSSLVSNYIFGKGKGVKGGYNASPGVGKGKGGGICNLLCQRIGLKS